MGTNSSENKDNNKSINTSNIKQVKTSYFFRKYSRDNAYNSLNEVLYSDSKKNSENTYKSSDSYETLLLKTCKIIGEVERIEFIEGFNNSVNSWSPLKRILRASNIRSRKITLDKEWWLMDQGPFLAFLKDDNTPVAIIRKKKKYILKNLKSNKELLVDKNIADTIEPVVHSFFSPLPKGKISQMDLLKFTLAFTKKDVVFFFVLGVFGALLSLFIPIMSGYIFNTIIPGGEKSSLIDIGYELVTLVLILGVINMAKSIAVLRFEGKSSYKLQSAVWDRILSLKVPFFSKYDAGNLAERSLGIEKIRTILSANVMGAIVAAIFSVFYLALMFYYDVTLTILALFLGLAVAAFTLTISRLAYKHVAGIMRMQAIISGFMMMMIGGIKKVRMTASEDKVFDIWADKYSQQKKHYADKQKLIIIATVFTYGFPILASLLIYIRIYDLLTVPNPSFSIGDFIAFNTAYLSFQGALISAFMVTVPLMSIKPTLDLLRPLLEAETEDYENKKDVGILTGEIEISNLNFKYQNTDNLILKNLNLKINAGEFVAIVGGSGSGKSTLIRVLLGFEDYDVGTILFNGMDMKEIDIRTIRDQTGVVLQNGKIMQGTVFYNIVGTSNYTEEEAWEAAKMAGCDEDINSLQDKMNTYLPAGGGILSGGQQQRIVIARALIKKPNLLFFDEATSALDNETQKTVTDNLNQLNATKIVIAHRLSTIRDADSIVVLEKGEIMEYGKYEDLIKNQGFFYNLVKNQMS